MTKMAINIKELEEALTIIQAELAEHSSSPQLSKALLDTSFVQKVILHGELSLDDILSLYKNPGINKLALINILFMKCSATLSAVKNAKSTSDDSEGQTSESEDDAQPTNPEPATPEDDGSEDGDGDDDNEMGKIGKKLVNRFSYKKQVFNFCFKSFDFAFGWVITIAQINVGIEKVKFGLDALKNKIKSFAKLFGIEGLLLPLTIAMEKKPWLDHAIRVIFTCFLPIIMMMSMAFTVSKILRNPLKLLNGFIGELIEDTPLADMLPDEAG